MKWPIPLVFLLVSCYSTPKIPGFNSDTWVNSLVNCDRERLASAELLVEAKSQLIGSTQNEIKNLLGTEYDQKLLDRHQKFMLYQLDCARSKALSIRFDALGRANDIRIVGY